MMVDLGKVRERIDEVDNKIKSLYMERLELTTDVAKYKIENNMPVFDKDRETKKIEALTGDIEDVELRADVARLFNKLMADSKKKQYKMIKSDPTTLFGFESISGIDYDNARIVYQGEPGAYSQAAANVFFNNPVNITNAKTWRDAAEMIKRKDAGYCVLPIENSTEGSVTEIYDILYEYDLSIIGEQVIPIEHALLGVKGAKISDVKEVFSHPQALMQCSDFFKNHPDIKQEKMINTAAAAKMIMEKNDKSLGAIAGAINAKLYGLELIQTSIQDEDNNKTRFVILSKEKNYLMDAKKVSVSFCLKHEKGSLYNALSFLNDNDINLSLIESRPIKDKNWEYRFFVDMEGNLNDINIQLALAGLYNATNDFRIMGNY